MKIGIYGGAFNPIHNGHVIIAIRVLEKLEIDELIIVPTYKPPHRTDKELAPYECRRKWVEIAFSGIDKILISDFEKQKGGISYSIDTIAYFTKIYGVKPFFIMGEDSAVNFDKWYKYEELKKLATFVVYPRFKVSKFDIIKKTHPEFLILNDLPLIEISSTEIRERVKRGESIRGMVDHNIEDEVIKMYREIFSKKG